MNRAIPFAVLFALAGYSSASATGRGDRIERQLDRKGERIDRRVDRRHGRD